MDASRKLRLERFYDLLDELVRVVGGVRTLAACDGRMVWPQRGVYFFLEPGELRSDTGLGPRVVRVGTHALTAGSNTTLWSRLSQHRGTEQYGDSNHRASIFRSLIGAALDVRVGYDCPTWGQGSSAPQAIRDREFELELAVSKQIGTMPFLWLAVNDKPGPDSLRGYVERNAIALLSNYAKDPLDPPSTFWLGHLCDRKRVQHSGLWNQNHVEGACGPRFLDTLERLIREMEDAP